MTDDLNKDFLESLRIIKRDNHVVGNIGLYYICYELSKRGWNVLPTSRNAKGIDILIYNQDATRMHTIQAKALSKKSPVPGMKKDSLIAEYLIVCRNVSNEKPEVFISKISDIKNRIHEGVKDGKKSYWLQPKDYEEFKDNWNIIGEGYVPV